MSEAMYTVSLDRVANQPVSEGMHAFVITDITEGESSNQNPMWTVRLKCLDGGDDEGKEATLWLVLIDSMRWKLEKFFDAVNAPTTGEVTYRQFIGRKFKAQIMHEKKDGRTNANIGEMFPMSAASASPKSQAPAAGTGRVKSTASTPVTRTGAPATAKVPKSKGLPADSTDGEVNF